MRSVAHGRKQTSATVSTHGGRESYGSRGPPSSSSTFEINTALPHPLTGVVVVRVRKSKVKRQAASDGGEQRKSSNSSFILAREILARGCLEMGLSGGFPGTVSDGSLFKLLGLE